MSKDRLNFQNVVRDFNDTSVNSFEYFIKQQQGSYLENSKLVVLEKRQNLTGFPYQRPGT